MRSDCRKTQDRFLAYLDRELDSRRRAEVDAHLSSCPDCLRELAGLRRTGELLVAWEAPLADEALSARLAAALAQRAARRPRGTLLDMGWKRAAWAACAVVVLAAGFFALREAARSTWRLPSSGPSHPVAAAGKGHAPVAAGPGSSSIRTGRGPSPELTAPREAPGGPSAAPAPTDRRRSQRARRVVVPSPRETRPATPPPAPEAVVMAALTETLPLPGSASDVRAAPRGASISKEGPAPTAPAAAAAEKDVGHVMVDLWAEADEERFAVCAVY